MNGIVATFNPRRAAQQQQQQAGANGKLDFKAAASINAMVEQVWCMFLPRLKLWKPQVWAASALSRLVAISPMPYLITQIPSVASCTFSSV
jgi:hypothetical protein